MKRFFTFIAVAALALAAQGSKLLTVCEGSAEGQITPFYGFMMDT